MEKKKILQIKKVSADDQYDFLLSLRGFNIQLLLMQSQIYHFNYTFVHKRNMKGYDYFEMFAEFCLDDTYFLEVGDAYVLNGLKIRNLIMDFQETIILRFGFDIENEVKDQQILAQSWRREPFVLRDKHSKSYKRLRFYYERTVLSQLRYLFDFACIFTAGKYRIPRVLTKQYDLPFSISYHLLNKDDHTVQLIIELLEKLLPYYYEIRRLNIPKLPKATRADFRKLSEI